ncbi:MAG: LamG domain-containing protein [Candidatus Brocadiae bacterium]|nr:LamG domain-containing protein [Candidatus Brocadiia bacterium]
MMFQKIAIIAILLIAAVPGYAYEIALKGYWNFDSNANDLSNYSNHGSVSGATWVSNGKFGGAYNFDGTDDRIDLGDKDSLNPYKSDMTIAAWVQADVNKHSRIFSKGTHGGPQPGYALLQYNGYAGYTGQGMGILGVAGHEHMAPTNTIIQNSNFIHIAATFDRDGVVKMYVNGVLQNTTVNIADHANVDIASGTLNAAIGASYSYAGSPGWNEFFDGRLDEIGVWSRVLSDSEISFLGSGDGHTISQMYNVPEPATFLSMMLCFAMIAWKRWNR